MMHILLSVMTERTVAVAVAPQAARETLTAS
jgi:hypothetical protein